MSALTAKLDLDPSGLKRGASEASRAVSDVKKDINELGGEIDRIDGKDVRVEVEADVAAAEADLKQVKTGLADLDSTVAEPKIESPDAGASGMTAGMDFAGAAIGSIGVAGIGAAIATAFAMGIDRIQMKARFEAQFGLVKADAERLSREAGDVYADGWGTSLQQVVTATGLVEQALVSVGDVAADESDEIVTAALAISDVFAIDVDTVIRATSLLMKNGLADSATDATDIIISGLQGGADMAGDFWDTIDEYSQHFGAMGLSGADMNAIIIDGLQNGQRDADKLADAVKEIRLRATETSDEVSDAYSKMGLNADTMRTKILQGGDAARDAYIQILEGIEAIEDPQDQHEAKLAIIGTQYEDLGPNGVESLLALTDATQDLTGTTEELVTVMDDATSATETMWRGIKQGASGATEEFAKSVNLWAGYIEDADAAIEEWERDLLNTNKLVGSLVVPIEDFGKSVDKSTLSLWDNVDSTDAATDASDDFEEALQDERDAAEELADQIDTLIESKLDLVGASSDVTRATIKAKDAERDLIAALADGTLTQDEKVVAMLDATDAQIGAATAAADYEIAQREANGQTVDAATKAGIQAEALRTVAGTLAPGSMLQLGLLDMADNIDDIERDVDVVIASNAGIESARMDTLANKIRNLPDKTVTVHIKQTGGISFKGTNIKAQDSGGYLGAGQVAQVAERRAEYVTTPTGRQLIMEPTMIEGPANITSGSETARMLASASTAHTPTSAASTGVANGGGGGPITVVNQKASASVADVAMAIRMARY